jgi:hypothetical protein
MTHTKTPWKVAEVYINNSPNQWHITTGKWGDKSIAAVNSKENAEFIVQAVNSHDELLEACKATLEHMRQEVNEPIEWADILDNENTICHQLNKAISKAEGTGKENDCY